MLAEGLSYFSATELIKVLKNNGIEANITVGAVSFWAEEKDMEKAISICKSFNAHVSDASMSEVAGYHLLSTAIEKGKFIKLPEIKQNIKGIEK